MRNLTATLLLAASLTSGLGVSANAQSTGAPAGREPATAPGGTTGLAGPRNEAEAIRSGGAIEVQPSAGAVPVPDSVVTGAPGTPMDAPTAPATRP